VHDKIRLKTGRSAKVLVDMVEYALWDIPEDIAV